MVKNLITYLLVFLYLVAMVRPVAPVIDYVVNQDYIAEFLCVNKDKPALRCNGKCHLMKQLKQQSEQKAANLPAIDLKQYPVGFVIFFDTNFLSKRTVKDKIISYRLLNPEELIVDVFHPPSIS